MSKFIKTDDFQWVQKIDENTFRLIQATEYLGTYKKLMETVTPEMILEQAGLSEIFEPKDCRIISPKEFDELYGED